MTDVFILQLMKCRKHFYGFSLRFPTHTHLFFAFFLPPTKTFFFFFFFFLKTRSYYIGWAGEKTTLFLFFLILFWREAESCCLAQVDLELNILLYQSPECWITDINYLVLSRKAFNCFHFSVSAKEDLFFFFFFILLPHFEDWSMIVDS